MEQITAAGNTEIPAYLALLRFGFAVTRTVNGEEENWVAEKTDLRLSAPTPLQLLGLYAMRQTRGSEWAASDDSIEEFLRRFK